MFVMLEMILGEGESVGDRGWSLKRKIMLEISAMKNERQDCQPACQNIWEIINPVAFTLG